MEAHHAADNRPITHFAMSGNRDRVGQDHFAPDEAVVRHVGVGHEEAPCADARDAGDGRAPVQRGGLTHHAAGSQDELGAFPSVFQVLRSSPHESARVNLAAFTDLRKFDHSMRSHGHTRRERYLFTDHGIGANLNRGIKARRLMNDSGRMDQSGFGCPHTHPWAPSLSTIAKLKVASVTSWPSTKASPFA